MEKEFKYSRKWAIPHFLTMVGIFVFVDVYILKKVSTTKELLYSQTLIVLLFCAVIYCLLMIYKDTVITKNKINVTPFGFYFFKFMKPREFSFNSIYSVCRMWAWRHGTFIDIWYMLNNQKKRCAIFYSDYDDQKAFLKSFIKNLPKSCTIEGFEREKYSYLKKVMEKRGK